MIPVTKPYLPDREKLKKYIDGIYERQWLTNNGQLTQELTRRLEDYLGVKNLLLVANGTLALQIAYRALGISDADRTQKPEAVTTPFTFIATASSLKWEGVQPVFVDIDPQGWCLDPKNIEAALTPNTRAIVPVHVFGNACEVEPIAEIAQRHNLKVVYDASHAFNVQYKGQSLLNWGDAATLSLHATKLFHTGEGGAIVFKRKEDLDRAKKIINFGISTPEIIDDLGVNGKMNELQAAMGLCVLDELDENIESRARIVQIYEKAFSKRLTLQHRHESLIYNSSYFPVVFESEEQALRVIDELKKHGISARRYFYPSLHNVTCLGSCEPKAISESIATRIVCLPVFSALEPGTASEICDLVLNLVGPETQPDA